MKRKLLAALCVTAMSAGLLAGCGSSDKTEESTKTEETAKEETSSQEETETKAASSDSDNVASEEEAEKAGFSDGSDEEMILLIQILKVQILQTAVVPVCFWILPKN